MAVDTPNPAKQEATADPADPEGLDAAAVAFGGQPQPEEGTQADPDPEPEGEADTEAEEADPDAAEPTDELAEVEFEGKTYKVAPELEKALLRQADYSRKMNEVSTKEKAYTQRLESLEGMEKTADKRAELQAVVKHLETQIKAFEGIDWKVAKEQNPAQAAMAAVELMELRQQRSETLAQAREINAEFKQAREKLLGEQWEEASKSLDKDLPGWRKEVGEKVTAYAKDKGIFTPEQLAATPNAALIVALDKARRFDELQASKTALKAKAQTAPPVTKPGAPRSAPNAKAEALKAHRKNGTIDSAAAAFLAL